MPTIDLINERPLFLSMSIPKEFHEELEIFHGYPFVWWAGQILLFLTRFNKGIEQVVKNKTNDFKFNNSCVGVHVRRSDKLDSEAAYHSLEEYMNEVDQFYDMKEMLVNKNTLQKRCVYLATDEPEVLEEAKSK